MLRQYPNLTGLTAAFTGHRPPKLGGYSEKVDEQLIALATFAMLKTKPAKVISGMALGWDMNVAFAAIRLKIPVVAAVPFKGQERMWPDQSRGRYNAILKACSEVVIVSPGDYASVKMQKRNEWMVNNCDHLIALWDGSMGGTYNCVAYAQGIKRPLLNLWQEWQTLIGGGVLL
jgi:uncharacterized phage-like protein YoqJ